MYGPGDFSIFHILGESVWNNADVGCVPSVYSSVSRSPKDRRVNCNTYVPFIIFKQIQAAAYGNCYASRSVDRLLCYDNAPYLYKHADILHPRTFHEMYPLSILSCNICKLRDMLCSAFTLNFAVLFFYAFMQATCCYCLKGLRMKKIRKILQFLI